MHQYDQCQTWLACPARWVVADPGYGHVLSENLEMHIR